MPSPKRLTPKLAASDPKNRYEITHDQLIMLYGAEGRLAEHNREAAALKKKGICMNAVMFSHQGLQFIADGYESCYITVKTADGAPVNMSKATLQTLYGAMSDMLTWCKHGTPPGAC